MPDLYCGLGSILDTRWGRLVLWVREHSRYELRETRTVGLVAIQMWDVGPEGNPESHCGPRGNIVYKVVDPIHVVIYICVMCSVSVFWGNSLSLRLTVSVYCFRYIRWSREGKGVMVWLLIFMFLGYFDIIHFENKFCNDLWFWDVFEKFRFGMIFMDVTDPESVYTRGSWYHWTRQEHWWV